VSLLTLTGVVKSYGYQDVLRGVSFFLSPGRHAGLIGPNGAGKSTILRLIAGDEKPDAGHDTLQPKTRVGMLAQDPLEGDRRTVLEAAQRPTPALQSAWDRLMSLEQGDLTDSVALHDYDEAQHTYRDLGGYECETRAKEVLAGLGFLEESWGKPVSVLSGGERTRLALTQILVDQPDLLLMDEPTNHVDWEACEWLQDYLRRYPGTALIVSHDRYFLDDTAQEIIEIDRGKARVYSGNYSAFAKKKAFEREQAELEFQRREEEIQRQQAVLQRLRSHRKFNSMHSREKVLERLQEEKREKPRSDGRKLKVRVGAVETTGREALTASQLSHRFGDRILFSGLNLSVERGQRLAVIGPNGAGKTTLLKILAGQLTPTRGEVQYGYRAQPAYFAQDLSTLEAEATVWESVWDTGALDLPRSIQALHQFLFVGEELEKKVGDLSGGEKTRLALCRLLASRPNLLLLDEPTNHLDLPSREAVEGALRSYPGAVIVVSHDRYFLDAVATQLLVLRGERHRLFDGNYREYRDSLPKPATAAPSSKKNAPPPPPQKVRTLSPSKRLPKLEKEIGEREARLAAVTEEIGAAAASGSAEVALLTAEFEALNHTLEALYAEWELVAAAVGA
jgi:ATP-binding cassette subfamily F protein 3